MNTIESGLAVGFIVYWLMEPLARPAFWNWLMVWWINHGPKGWYGKPLTCELCLSFWFAVIAVAIMFAWDRYVSYSFRLDCTNCDGRMYLPDYVRWLMIYGSYILSTSGVALVVKKILSRLDIVFVSKGAA